MAKKLAKIHVKPSSAKMLLKHPVYNRDILQSGEYLAKSTWLQRRLNDGDLVLIKKAKGHQQKKIVVDEPENDVT